MGNGLVLNYARKPSVFVKPTDVLFVVSVVVLVLGISGVGGLAVVSCLIAALRYGRIDLELVVGTAIGVVMLLPLAALIRAVIRGVRESGR